jgi:hypothetical protein
MIFFAPINWPDNQFNSLKTTNALGKQQTHSLRTLLKPPVADRKFPGQQEKPMPSSPLEWLMRPDILTSPSWPGLTGHPRERPPKGPVSRDVERCGGPEASCEALFAAASPGWPGQARPLRDSPRRRSTANAIRAGLRRTSARMNQSCSRPSRRHIEIVTHAVYDSKPSTR